MPETSKLTSHPQTPDLQSHLPPVTLIWASSRHLKPNVSKTQLIFLFQLLRPKISVFCSHPFKKSIPSGNPTLFVLSSKYIHTMATSHTLSSYQPGSAPISCHLDSRKCPPNWSPRSDFAPCTLLSAQKSHQASSLLQAL